MYNIAIIFFQNHCIERIWVEINGRVNFPIKTALIQLEENGDLNMSCRHVKFCVSWFTIRVAHVGTTLAVNAWNEHSIPGILFIYTPQLPWLFAMLIIFIG